MEVKRACLEMAPSLQIALLLAIPIPTVALFPSTWHRRRLYLWTI
jgi:hypothetical protein